MIENLEEHECKKEYQAHELYNLVPKKMYLLTCAYKRFKIVSTIRATIMRITSRHIQVS